MIREILSELRAVAISLRLTVALLVFGLILIFAATLDQTNLGIWGIQEKWFRTFVVRQDFHGLSLPLFPGGYLIGGLLLVNLIAAHLYRFKLSWRKAGLLLVHTGLILLLVGELLSGIWQEEFHLRLNEGETKNYAESSHYNEVAITDTTDPKIDEVVAIPETLLARGTPLQSAKLPFRVIPKAYYPNAQLRMRAADAPPSPANVGLGLSVSAVPQAVTYKTDEENAPAAYLELAGNDGSPKTFLVSTTLVAPQEFTYGGRNWKITMRAKRQYWPYSLSLLKFTHDRYAGTEIPKNFASRIRLSTTEGRDDREVLISMNNPLRYAGLTFYQAGFENNDRTTILQIVRNPSWALPYIACSMMGLGLLLQFGTHLFAFVNRSRRQGQPTPKPNAAEPKPKGGLFPRTVLAFALVAVAFTFIPAPRTSEFALGDFGRLPTLVNGRIKPLDTVARTTLLLLQGRQRVTSIEGLRLSPTEWLLDVFFRPEKANHYPVFEIVHPEILALTNLKPEDGAGKKRFSYAQLAGSLHELDRQAGLAENADAPTRTAFQRGVIQLRENLVLYQRLQSSFIAPGSEHFLESILEVEKRFSLVSKGNAVVSAAIPNAADSQVLLNLGQSTGAMETMSYLFPIPPDESPEVALGWKSTAASLREGLTHSSLNAAVATYAKLGLAWQEQNAGVFNDALHVYRSDLAARAPSSVRKCAIEAQFNFSEPFYTSMLLYIGAFLLALVSWLRWPQALGRAAFYLVAIAFVLSTAGIAIRMWLENRPPVTNLYSSALFVGWASVGLCLVLEKIYRNGIGSVVAGLTGFATLLIAHHLALSGDTLEMMRAVLDSNFWLATHVVTVTVGYSATFLAGFLGLVYLVRSVFKLSLDEATADALQRMIYGIICFATLFSFVGTILGGIWADQSWGRFWGWDPKENGALIIVIWNSLILHARWGGMVGKRGIAGLAVFGNIVTSWSWFGVNMLGVGLHSYGFMDAAFWWLIAFVVSQLAIIVLAFVPEKNPSRSLGQISAARLGTPIPATPKT